MSDEFSLTANVTGLVPVLERELARARRRAPLHSADTELKEAQERYRLIVETAGEGIWTVDEAGRTTFVNERMCEMLGYSAHELVGRISLDFVSEDEKDAARAAFRVLHEAGRGEFELALQRKDGRRVEVVISASCLFDDEGSLLGSLGMVSDVTAQKQAVEQLLRAEELHRTLTENLPIVTYLGPLQGTRTASYMSPQIEELTGYSAEEWLADPDLYPRIIHPEDRKRVFDEISASNESGARLELEYRILRKDGTLAWIRDESLAIEIAGARQALGFAHDITARKESERRLSAQHAVASVLAQAPSAAKVTRRILRAICVSLGIEFGALWRVDPEADVLRPADVWTSPAIDLSAYSVKTRSLRLRRGEGLPGRVWERDEPIWYGDFDELPGEVSHPRLELARSLGLQGAFAFPVTVAGEVLAVMEFYSAHTCDPDPELLHVLAVLGAQIGQFLKRTRAEEEQRKAEGLYRSLVEHLPLATYVDAAQSVGANVFASPQIEPMFGYTASEWQADPGLLERIVHSDDRERVLAAAARTRATGEPFREEYRILARDGRVVWVRDESVVVEDESGGPSLVQGYFLDISEQKRAAERLQASEERFRSVFESAAIGIEVVGVDGRIIGANPALERMLGYEPGELGGRTLEEITHPDDWPDDRLQMLVGGALDGDVVQSEQRYLRRDGATVWARLVGTLVRSQQGTPQYAIGMVEDVTDRKELEAQFVQAQKMEAVGRLAGGVAHDFNNMLLAIRGYTELALRELGENGGSIRECLEEISAAADRSATLTRELLAFSRTQVLQPAEADLNEVVMGMERLLGRLISKKVEVTFALDQELGRVKIDRGRMEQGIVNLVVNARDAMPDGGRLELRTSNVELPEARSHHLETLNSGRYVLLSVSDTGEGMDAETKRRIFEPFFTTKAPELGTGLGLSTVFGFVTQSEGQILVESEPGRGTTFEIFLPRIS